MLILSYPKNCLSFGLKVSRFLILSLGLRHSRFLQKEQVTSVNVYYDYKNPYLEKQVKKQQMMFQAGRKEIVHILMSEERILLKD